MNDEYAHQYEPDGYRHRNSCWYVMDKTRACDCRTFAADVAKMAIKLEAGLKRILAQKRRETKALLKRQHEALRQSSRRGE